MEIISRPFNGGNYWKKKGYSLLNGATAPRRKIQVVQIAGGGVEERSRRKRFWRLRKPRVMTPKKVWMKFREGYVKFMLRVAGHVDGESEFTGKRISHARKIQPPPAKHDVSEFERRLVLEIYKSLATSRGISEI